MLDTLIVGLASCALLLFVFWFAGEIAGVPLLVEIPGYLAGMARGVWAWLTGGAASLVLYGIRRQIRHPETIPSYPRHILVTTLALAAAVVLAAALIPFLRNLPHRFSRRIESPGIRAPSQESQVTGPDEDSRYSQFEPTRAIEYADAGNRCRRAELNRASPWFHLTDGHDPSHQADTTAFSLTGWKGDTVDVFLLVRAEGTGWTYRFQISDRARKGFVTVDTLRYSDWNGDGRVATLVKPGGRLQWNVGHVASRGRTTGCVS
jgi:hypothetical protein